MKKLICSCCGNALSVENFYIITSKNRSRLDGEGLSRSHQCKQCQSKKYKSLDPRIKLLNAARSRAKRDDLPFGIIIDDIEIPKYCPVLGIKLTDGTGSGSKNAGKNLTSPSLDKMNPSKGYVPGNICVISKLANTLKGSASEAEIRAIIAYMSEWGERVPLIQDRDESTLPFLEQI